MSESWIDQPTAIRQGEELDVRKLQAYLQQAFTALEGPISVGQFPSGYSNLTYWVQVGGKEYVLRRPPFGANIKSAHDMAREYRILETLLPVYAKVPRPLLYCADTEVLGAEFYMMERVQGLILRQKPPKGLALNAELMRGISAATIDSLAELHAIDVQATGLHSLGKPEGYVQRQVEGWTARYRKAETETVEGMDAAAAWLAAHLPTSDAAALIHNDFKYDNLVLHPQRPTEVLAVLDWEMATIGDPLMDLGTTLAYWADAQSPQALQAFSLTAFPGNMSRQEVLDRYAQKSGRNVDDFVFYYVFGCFKIGVIVQQIYARYKKGFTQDPRFAKLIDLVHAFGQCATQAIASGRISS